MLGVPPFLLANSDPTFSNSETFNRLFVQYSLRTWCKRIEGEINSKLFRRAEMGRFFVRFNLDSLLRGDTNSRARYYQTMFNVRALSPNDIRALENMNPYEGGEEYGLPLASNTKELVSNEQEL